MKSEMREVLEMIDPDHDEMMQHNAPEDAEVAALCRKWGYGAVMASAARLWYRRDPVGAFVSGPCVGTVRSVLGRKVQP